MKNADNQALVIFGASGDLTARKLIPAVFKLYCGDFLPDCYAIIGVSRTEFSHEEFRKKVVFENKHLDKEGVGEDKLKSFAEKLYYLPTDTSSQEDYDELKVKLYEIDSSCKTERNFIFYLSTPPSLYDKAAKKLAKAGLSDQSDGWKRLVIEKPFGYDLKTAKELNKKLLEDYEEDQLYRIDHYLGKETVQNLFVTRFANSIFEPLWNRNYVNHIEITSAESVGVEKRGGYYDDSGAMRDMVQNHLLQLVALVAMEPPVQTNELSIRNEKLKIFQSLRPLLEEDIKNNVIFGQYVESKIRGEKVNGYRQEEGVNPKSRTETFVAMKFFIDNWRWAGVPFYIRTGKRLPTRVTEVVVHFKPNHHHLFLNHSSMVNSQNMLVIRIQPHEGILLKFGVKVPGAGFNVENVNMDFHYEELTDAYVPDAYERLILDCMQGDATLYARGDSVESAWEFIDPILEKFENDTNMKIYGYPAGTWGPEESEELISAENMDWRYPCKNLTDDGNYCEL